MSEPAAGPAPSTDGPGSGLLVEGPTFMFGFNLGKIPDQGEDSDPIVRHGRDLGLVAVFDGMGGAGGTVYETPEGPRTGAYLASRVARDVVERRMLDLVEPDWNFDGAAAAKDVQVSVKQALQARLAELDAPQSGLRSKLLRALPTTMSLVTLQRKSASTQAWSGHALWAGDSRSYVVTPSAGVQQLTTDDIRDEGDAMANLTGDSVVSNAMSADTDFEVHYRHVDLKAPFLLVSATDGCFGYVRSPMHFELMLIRQLLATTDVDSWSAGLQREIAAITGDDAAMALLGVGASFEEFQSMFSQRAKEVQDRFTTPLDEATAQLEEAEQRLREVRERRSAVASKGWNEYKAGYETFLGPGPGDGDDEP